MNVRNAKLKDIDAIFKIQENANGVDKEDREWLSAFLKIKSSRKFVLVAENDKTEIVGFLIAYKYRDKAYINTIAVSEKHRDKGIGSLLLKNIEDELLRRGVWLVTLSVKSDNKKALDFYLRRGYTFSKLVFILEASIDKFQCNDMPIDYKIKKVNPTKIRYKALRMSTWWSLLIEPVDKLIYKKKIYSREEAIAVLDKNRIKGFVEYYTNSSIEVENLGLSSYQDEDSLRALMCALKKVGTERGITKIRVYVDSSKTLMLKALEDIGFRIVDAEYLLEKDLQDN